MNPPPMIGKSIFDKNGRFLRRGTLKVTEEEKMKYEKWKTYINEIKKDSSKLIVAFAPELREIRDKVKSDFEKHFSKVKLNKTKNGSETIYNFVFSGVLDFTRIRFDKTKQYGVLDAGFGRGGKFGQGYRIYQEEK